MANVTISDLTTNASPASTDLYPQDTAGGTTGKVTAEALVRSTSLLSKVWTVNLSAAGEAADKIVVTATVKDLAGTTLASATVLSFALASTADASYAVSDEGSGTGLTTGANNISQFTTAATGIAEIGFTDTAAETIKIVFFTPQGPVLQSLTFA